MVPIDLLVVEPDYQPRVRGLEEWYVGQLEQADEFPPLLVTPLSDGKFLVIDGAHRLEAVKRKGATEVPVTIREGLGYWEAFVANRDHGLALTVEDRKEAARFLRHDYADMSLRQIAREVGLSPHTVTRALEDDGQEDTGVQTAQIRYAEDTFKRFIRLLVRAYEEGDGTLLGLGDRARYVARVIADMKNPEAAWQALEVWWKAVGEALKARRAHRPSASGGQGKGEVRGHG